MNKPAIIIPAFKREKSLSRLLRTVNDAEYPDENINLIISLDQGASADVKKTSENFDFKHGDVQIIEHSRKLGLKDHILECADFSLEYGSVIVLEEDLLVSSGYYLYAQKALDYYENETSVAGISLYSQRFNETAQLPFEPLETEYAVYFLKLVCSWGQAWTGKQWKEFKEWFSEVDDTIIERTTDLPGNVKDWSENSWKKFFNTYLLKKNKFFVYPYNSYSTHCGDEKGEHIRKSGNLFQVPLSEINPKNQQVQLPDFDRHLIRYDMHMECCSEFMNTILKLDSKKMAIDLYGTKSIKQLQDSDYILSSKKFKSPIQSFPLQFKPIELNIKYNSFSNDHPFFYLYKTEEVMNSSFSTPNYFRLAKYLSYQNFYSKRTVKDLFKLIFK